ncbi:MAG TPA: hypothetical protein VNN10_07150 [Dehalococcoidia bacterium]|nr:hypothetical protein [Dehalococcoidia bacterium]
MTQERRLESYGPEGLIEQTPAESSVEVEHKPSGLEEAEPASGARAMAALGADHGSLLEDSDAGRFRGRWDSIQASFVDRPRESVREAEALLEEVFSTLTQAFSRQREGLEEQWQRGGEPSTEDLRLAIQRYRTLFQRLLNA